MLELLPEAKVVLGVELKNLALNPLTTRKSELKPPYTELTRGRANGIMSYRFRRFE